MAGEATITVWQSAEVSSVKCVRTGLDRTGHNIVDQLLASFGVSGTPFKANLPSKPLRTEPLAQEMRIRLIGAATKYL